MNVNDYLHQFLQHHIQISKMASPSHIEELKRELIDYPEKCEYKLNKDDKKQLRKLLFKTISCGGIYLNWLFPYLAQDCEKLEDILDNEAQWLFEGYDVILARRENFQTSGTHAVYHVNLPCARIFRRGEPIYKCLTCGFDETCALCSHCFQAEQHQGHIVHINICQRENGGVCDCGDPEAWVGHFACKYALNDHANDEGNADDIPADLKESFRLTMSVLLDYIIDVMSQSDPQLHPFEKTASEKGNKSIHNTLDPQRYSYDGMASRDRGKPSETFALMVYNDQIRHFRDAVQRIHLASRKVPEFATMVAEKIQTHGRATVVRSKDLGVLTERQRTLSLTGLTSCIRNARDEVREDICETIILWLSILTQRDCFRSSQSLKNILCLCFCDKWNPGFLDQLAHTERDSQKNEISSALHIPNVDCLGQGSNEASHWFFKPTLWDLDVQLCEECDYNLTHDDFISTGFRGSRFQYFIYFDIRFWKSIRSELHDLYLTSLVTNLKYKKLFACQYVDIYPIVAELFLTVDGEPELNIMSKLSSQLFTCPSHSTAIIHHGDVSRIFLTIFNFLRSGHVGADSITLENANKLSIKSLKNRRWGQIFFDIGYILSRGKDRELILTSNIIPMACDILGLFQGRPVLRRETEHHVEYESSDYTAFFHAILVVYQFAEYISLSITNLESNQRRLISLNAIDYVIRYLLHLECKADRGTHMEYNEADYGSNFEGFGRENGKSSEVAKMSFLHPLHSFLSWLIEFSNFSFGDQFLSLIHSTINEVLLSSPELGDFEACVQVIFKYPVQTVVLASQIKSGFWVRNGFSVRSQLQLYKSTSLREQGYLRDLFLIQVFTVCSTPDTVMAVFLKKWLLLEWALDDCVSCSVYEPSILPYILEECLSFFLHILTEDVFLRGLTTESTKYLQIKNEVIHNLCFGPMTYSALCAQIPEHVFMEKKFDTALDELTLFKTPNSPKDTGTYSLKEKYFDEVDPYYFNYTINKKDDAIKLLKDRIHKTAGIPYGDIAISPRSKDVKSYGIYKYLGNFTTSQIFMRLLVKITNHIRFEGPGKLDGLLDTVLHLIHVCSLENLVDFSRYGSVFQSCFETKFDQETSLGSILYVMLLNVEFKTHHAKLRAIFDSFRVIHTNLVDVMQCHIKNFDAEHFDEVMNASWNENKDERKKRIAKGRQEKLIAKFKKQQTLFSKLNNVISDCSDIEMTEEEEGWKFPEPHCILCQDTAESAGPFGIITHISKTAEFRQVPFDNPYWFLKAFSDPVKRKTRGSWKLEEIHSQKWLSYMENITKENVIGPGFTDQKCVHSNLVSLTCGHGMHFQCYTQYLSSSKSRLNQITRNNPDNVEHREFLCPLCKAISNMFIPILWSSNNRSLSNFVESVPHLQNPFDSVLEQSMRDTSWLLKFSQQTTEDLVKFSLLTNSAKEMIGISAASSATQNQQQFKMLLTNMWHNLSLLSFPQILRADSPKVLVNSIKSCEISLRATEVNPRMVNHQLSNNNLVNLRALNEFRITSLLSKFSKSFHPQEKGQFDAQLKYIATLQSLTAGFFNTTIIDSDFFEILVSLFPVPSASITFNDVLRSCFLGTIIQNLHIIVRQVINHAFYSNEFFDLLDIPYSEGISESDACVALQAFEALRIALRLTSRNVSIVNHPHFGRVIYSMLLKSVTPFLRRSAIYTYVCCENVDDASKKLDRDNVFEADEICSFLHIPDLADLLRLMLNTGEESSWEAGIFSSFKGYLMSYHEKALSGELTSPRMMEYPGDIRLVDLPERLDKFFTEYYYLDKYRHPHLRIDNPAICLLCAEVVDAQKRAFGSPFGQCSTHLLKECISNVGMFLLPKDKCLVLLHKNGGTFHDMPYFDLHGEPPSENKKGRTLHLLKLVYDDFIKTSWLQHSVPNLIVRKLDSVIDAGGWDTL